MNSQRARKLAAAGFFVGLVLWILLVGAIATFVTAMNQATGSSRTPGFGLFIPSLLVSAFFGLSGWAVLMEENKTYRSLRNWSWSCLAAGAITVGLLGGGQVSGLVGAILTGAFMIIVVCSPWIGLWIWADLARSDSESRLEPQKSSSESFKRSRLAELIRALMGKG